MLRRDHQSVERAGSHVTGSTSVSAELSFENIKQRYGEDLALDGVSLTVKPGEIMCLLGPSGCGKTTLLRIASGITRPSSGRVLLNHVEVAGPDTFVPPEKRNVGLMFQDFALFPHLTILDNVTFGLTHLPKPEAESIGRNILRRMGLERYTNEYPHVLSGGQQQRVALARALVPEPSVVLMDEPFSGLDLSLRTTIQKEAVRLLKASGATVMIVTHDPEEAMNMGDRIAVMRKGRILQVGTSQELFRDPSDLAVARMFSNHNELEGVVENGKLSFAFGTFDAPGIEDGTTAVLCIRHLAIQFVPAGSGHPVKILRTRFLGDIIDIDIEVAGYAHPMTVRSRESRIAPLGSEIGIQIDPKEVRVFPSKCLEDA